MTRGGDAVRVCTIGKCEATMEAAVTSLDPREALGLHRAFAASLAFDRQNPLVHLHFDILGIDAGQVGVQHEPLGFFLDVDEGHPLAGDYGRLIDPLWNRLPS